MKIVNMDPDDPIPFFITGNILTVEGNRPGAEKMYRRSLQKAPDFKEAASALDNLMVLDKNN